MSLTPIGSFMPTVTLLGTAQDGGRPQPGCQRPCCADLEAADVRHPVSLGITDEHGRGHLIEATRAMGEQLKMWGHPPLQSVLLTHAHFGHVDGLGLFGRETLNARGLNLYASSSMLSLIDNTPQWALMMEQGVFTPVLRFNRQRTCALRTPHCRSCGGSASGRTLRHARVHRAWTESLLLFLPDHDRWQETLDHHGAPSIRSWLTALEVDIALIDGTFWSADELSSRTQHEVPHPPVSETLERLGPRLEGDPEIVFIHMNHTNPIHRLDSDEHAKVQALGWSVGEQGMTFTL